MSPEDLGRDYQNKTGKYLEVAPQRVGLKLLEQNPVYWERMDDNSVAAHLEKIKDPKFAEPSGIFSFFSKMGERQRNAYFAEKVKSAKALVALEEEADRLHHIELQRQLAPLLQCEAIAAIQARIHAQNLEAGRRELAARTGESLLNYDNRKSAEAAANIVRENEAHTHRLQSETHEQANRHVLVQKDKDSDLHIRNTTNDHLLNQEIERLRAELQRQQLDQQHKHERDLEALKFQLREKEKELEFSLKEREIEKEVEGTLRMHNTAELSRAQMIQLICDYDKKLTEATSDFQRRIFRREIERLEKELYRDEPGGMAGKAAAGNNPEGGSTPSEPGGQPKDPQGPDKPTDSPKGSGFVN